MRLLVTGGAGFIGSHFIRHLLVTYPSYYVINLDKLTYAGNLENLADLESDPRYHFIQGDVCEPSVVDSLAREVDVIVNFAAESVVADTFIPVHWGHGIKLLTAEKLFATYAKKRDVITDSKGIEIVALDLPLFALSFRNGMGRWQRITHITRHRYAGKVATLRQKWGSVTVTRNHSVYDADAKLVAAETNPELLAIRKINIDRSRHRDYLDIHLPEVKSVDGLLFTRTAKGGGRPREVYVRQSLKGEALLALMRFLGGYVSEGNALFNRANGSWQICIANSDLDFLEQLQRDAELFTNAASSMTLREKPGVHQLVFSSHILFVLVTELCGAHSFDKKVPDAMFTLGDEYKEAFLSTYLGGDGSTKLFKTMDTRRFTTVSPRLAAGLGLLLSMLDLDYSLSYREFEDQESWRSAYTINIVSSYDSRTGCEYSEQEYDGYVYDLTVEGTHNFVAGIGNIVVHNTHVDRSILEPGSFIRTDVQGTHILLEAARKYQHRRYVQISTDEVYGSIDTGLFSEDAPLQPSSPYAASKAAGDLLTLSYFKTYGLPAIVTRSSNNFGPNQYPEKLIPLFITNAIEGNPLPVYGDGMNVRDWLYVMDNCRAIDLVLHRGQAGSIYNIGGDNQRTNIEVTRLILRELGRPETLIQYVHDRAGHDRRYALDCKRIAALGFRAAFGFEEALRATVHWYVEHAAWWRKLRAGEFQRYYHQQYEDR